MSGISFRELDPHDRYKLLCGVVVPRPIALVTTLDENGGVNAAPFSFFNVFSEDPPLVVLGLQHKADFTATGRGTFRARVPTTCRTRLWARP